VRFCEGGKGDVAHLQFRLNREGFEPSLPNVPGRPVMAMVAPGVRRQEPLHPTPEVAVVMSPFIRLRKGRPRETDDRLSSFRLRPVLDGQPWDVVQIGILVYDHTVRERPGDGGDEHVHRADQGP